MVELEYDGVPLSAIDARMRSQMIGDDATIARAIDRRVHLRLARIHLDVLPIVLSAVLTAATAAVRPIPPLLRVLDRELAQRFCDVTPGTESDDFS